MSEAQDSQNNPGGKIDAVSNRHARRKIQEVSEHANKALEFLSTYGLVAESLKVPPLLARPFSDDAASKNEDTVDLRVLYFLIAAPPQSGIQSTQELQASTSVINRDPTVQQSVASQQPTQFQNIAGPVQPIYGNPAGQPLYYVPGYPYPRQENVQDPVKMAYANLPTQPHPTSFTPQLYGGNVLSTPQQPVILVQPTPVPISSAVRPTSGDNYLTLSVLMTFLVLLVGDWLSLLCTVSALFVSFNAKEEEKRGNIAAARAKANISLGLNIAAVVFVGWYGVLWPFQ
ncbi:hypothetical protein EMCRGX_G007333 [Ephydatia muelleri]